MRRTKVSILGGGVGGLTTAFYLSRTPELREKYEVTVRQLGWRLGGKGRTGRNLAHGKRAEEHGYHLLFGFYQNVFEMLRECYGELHDRGLYTDVQLFAPTQAQEADPEVVYAFHRQHLWRMWSFEPTGAPSHVSIRFTPNDQLPGDENPATYADDLLGSLLTFARFMALEVLESVAPSLDDAAEELGWLFADAYQKLTRGLDRILSVGGRLGGGSLTRFVTSDLGEQLDEALGEMLQGVHGGSSRSLLESFIEVALKGLWEAVSDHVHDSWPAYLIWVAMDFVLTATRGVLADDLLKEDADKISDERFHDWFQRHASVPEGSALTVGSFWMQVAYDASFAYLKGDSTTPADPEAGRQLRGFPDMDAATALRGALRMALGYKGALAWAFQAGCGEILVTPLYQCLRERGVRFELFESAEELILSQEGGEEGGEPVIEELKYLKQVPLAQGVQAYEPPLIETGFPIPGWGSEPDWAQLAPSDPEARPDFECPFEPWPDAVPATLRRGVDFDLLVLAIPVGAQAKLCRGLAEKLPRWKKMLETARTTRTGGVQLWFDRPLTQLTVELHGAAENVASYPLETWADMTHLLPTEEHEPGIHVHGMAMICGAIPDDPEEPEGPTPGYLESQRRALREMTRRMLDERVGHVMPALTGPNGFSYQRLSAPASVEGEARLDAQFYSANISPSDRYVLSPAGALRDRLAADESGVANLFLAGDWIRSGLDAGCMEGTVMSGKQAARAISGEPLEVPFEDLLRTPKGSEFSS